MTPAGEPAERCEHRSAPSAADPAAGKAALRTALRRRRRALLPALRAAETAATISLLTQWLAARPRPLAGTWASGSELDLAALYRQRWAVGEPVWLPRVSAPRRLAWAPVRAEAELVAGAHGLCEPAAATGALPHEACLLVPGLGFGPDGRRLGQGGGYFDQVLTELPAGTLAIGVGFACQWCPELPEEAHDRRVAALLVGGSWRLRPP